ncbi:MAG: hypothetical protein Q8S14_00590 [Algoriphagus sp.]|uniref:hypothetical protein n=1 Tax=Algoriphagus sp. TaxID=1872435 RepID=UPI0027322918|nr:hypothetical protein [Algoriphagus sp.]MDP2039937.1 hypothetical protein [Algoriphagus sp.]MDP3470338.1 hypothetical protein [Algoriphagus sp.]
MMNLFLARRHSEVLEVEDPEFRLELVDAVEFGTGEDIERSSLFANLYYRKINHVIN